MSRDYFSISDIYSISIGDRAFVFSNYGLDYVAPHAATLGFGNAASPLYHHDLNDEDVSGPSENPMNGLVGDIAVAVLSYPVKRYGLDHVGEGLLEVLGIQFDFV